MSGYVASVAIAFGGFLWLRFAALGSRWISALTCLVCAALSYYDRYRFLGDVAIIFALFSFVVFVMQAAMDGAGGLDNIQNNGRGLPTDPEPGDRR